MGLDKDAMAKALGATPSDHEWASDCGPFGPVKLACNRCGLMKSPGEKDGISCAAMRADSDEILNLVADFFDGDPAKTELWMRTDNPLLGGISPEFMVRIGRSGKLLKIVRQCLDENKI